MISIRDHVRRHVFNWQFGRLLSKSPFDLLLLIASLVSSNFSLKHFVKSTEQSILYQIMCHPNVIYFMPPTKCNSFCPAFIWVLYASWHEMSKYLNFKSDKIPEWLRHINWFNFISFIPKCCSLIIIDILAPNERETYVLDHSNNSYSCCVWNENSWF